MTIMIEDRYTERLVQQLANAQGVSMSEVVREGVMALAKMRGMAPAQAPLRERLAKLALEIQALPKVVQNTLPDDVILGYDEQGQW